MIKLFLTFLFLISTILLGNSYYIIGGVLLLISIFLVIKHKLFSRKYIIILAIMILFIILKILLAKFNFYDVDKIIGIITKKADNYIIVSTLFKKYYVYLKDNNYDLFDIIKVSGNVENYYFSTLESSFDFNNYLKSIGVFYEINDVNIEYIYNFPINIITYKNNVINQFDNEEVQYLINAILFNKINNNYTFNSIFNYYNLINIFCVLTIIQELSYKLINYFLFLIFDRKKSDLITILIMLPILIINIDRFSIIRFFIFKFLRYINRYKLNKLFQNIDIISIIGISFLLINPFLAINNSFIIPFLIMIFLNFSSMFLNKFRKIKRKLIQILLVLLILEPLFLVNTNSINLISMFLRYLFIPISFLFYLLLIPSLFFLKIPFIEPLIKSIFLFLNNLKLDNFFIAIPSFNEIGYLIYYGFIVFIIYFYEINHKKLYKFTLSSFLILTNLYLLPISNYLSFEVSFINIGQGDSTLIRYHNTSILIDTGGLNNKDLATESLIPFLRGERLYKIDALFITHNDFDHYGAKDSLKEHFKVKNEYSYNDYYPIKIGDLDFINYNIYWNKNSEENDKSLVLFVNIKGIKFLFMGDAPKEVESKIINDSPNLECDILKVGHHGSNTSTSNEFIKKINPKIAIISCGYKNKYKHPNIETLNVLNKNNIVIRRTDLEGSIKYKFYLK